MNADYHPVVRQALKLDKQSSTKSADFELLGASNKFLGSARMFDKVEFLCLSEYGEGLTSERVSGMYDDLLPIK